MKKSYDWEAIQNTAIGEWITLVLWYSSYWQKPINRFGMRIRKLSYALLLNTKLQCLGASPERWSGRAAAAAKEMLLWRIDPLV